MTPPRGLYWRREVSRVRRALLLALAAAIVMTGIFYIFLFN